MAKLLTEFISFEQLEILQESIKDASGVEKKVYKLKGPFLEANIKNKNGRIYPGEVLNREVKDFCETKIKTKRSMGELDHPENPQINLERVSHIIEDLYMKDNTGFGVAKIIDTPMGRIAETLVREGVVVGMSTRGVGSLDGDKVQGDYKLITIDIVADPSAPNAFVEGVLENKEYIIGKDGDIVEVAINNMKKKLDERYDKFGSSKKALCALLSFMEDIKNSK
jgi:hypothetical protein